MRAVGFTFVLYSVLTPLSAFANPQVQQWAEAGCRAALGGAPYAGETCKAIATSIYTYSGELTASCKNACRYVACAPPNRAPRCRSLYSKLPEWV